MRSSALPPGVHVPLVTPFADGGEVALDALERLAHTCLDEGAAGLVALGTTAEVSTLTGEERAAVLGVVTRVCRDRGAPLTVGAGGNDTAAARRALAALTEVPEAVAALSLVPYFTRPSEAGVVAHFTALAAASPVPLLVYHVPYRTGQELSARTLCALGAIPNVAGVKYAAGAVTAATVELMATRPPGFAVYAGDDVLLSPLLALGAEGGILASAHLATRGFAELADAWRGGDGVRAAALGRRLSVLSAALFAEPNPTVVKAVLHARGRIPAPGVRLPLLPAGREPVARALGALAALDG
ncbi:dihydrodipicolinate synthase family protein [Streptomyces sp. NPDC060194]|uniref:dihydrodipicolinate synthase family protein n=1 Tax=Streptomyces sp. NPDC060194 TaxID=3347069 RepID=UPI00365FD7B7